MLAQNDDVQWVLLILLESSTMSEGHSCRKTDRQRVCGGTLLQMP